MPIVLSEANPLYGNLEQERTLLLTPEQAQEQDIHAARVGILNLMPGQVWRKTERLWLRHISHGILQIEPVLIKFDDDERERPGGSRHEHLKRYQPFSEVKERGLDGLIVTGDNLEVEEEADENGNRVAIPFTGEGGIRYAKKLGEVIDWADENVPSTIYSCLAAHFALNHKFGLKRDIAQPKIFGVEDHTRLETSSPFTEDMNDIIRAPHSRWGNVAPEQIKRMGGVALLAVSDRVGWLLAEGWNSAGGRDLFIQGHPEYSRYDLHDEYQRDVERGLMPALPTNYYIGNNPNAGVNMSWKSDARALHDNWISYIYQHFSDKSQ